MSEIRRFLAFDIGATSGRSILATLRDGTFEINELTRFPNNLLTIHGKYHWDIFALFQSLKEALRQCAKENIAIDAIGIDTWGVDFGYLGADGTILGLPRAYRDPYTNGVPDLYFERCMSRKEVYERTGIQIMNFNSLYQLYAAQQEEFSPYRQAERILFTPDLLSYLLTGNKVVEYTIASTSQLINPCANDFDLELLKRADIPTSLLSKPVFPGTVIGNLTSEVMAETGMGPVPVIAVTGHDTAAAVVAVPAADPRFAYLSSGTWSLMGIEVDSPIINEHSYSMNFTNEGGINGTTRFLKNITGMWLFEQCRREWAREGREYTYKEIDEMILTVSPHQRFVDPDHSSFATPTDMTKAIVDYCHNTGQSAPQTDAEVVRCIFESLALKYRSVIEMLEKVSPFPIEKLHVIGGGSKNRMLNQWTADAINRTVIAGPGEATAIGNVMVQALAVGCVSTLDEIRQIVRDSVETETYNPHSPQEWDRAYQLFSSKCLP